MSGREFEEFRRAQQEVATDRFAVDAQKCADYVGTGRYGEFTSCVDYSWKRFTTKAQHARYIAGQRIRDAAKQCRPTLRSYRIVLSQYYATLNVVHEYALDLQLEDMAAALKQVPAATRRYGRFALNALRACEPR